MFFRHFPGKKETGMRQTQAAQSVFPLIPSIDKMITYPNMKGSSKIIKSYCPTIIAGFAGETAVNTAHGFYMFTVMIYFKWLESYC